MNWQYYHQRALDMATRAREMEFMARNTRLPGNIRYEAATLVDSFVNLYHYYEEIARAKQSHK